MLSNTLCCRPFCWHQTALDPDSSRLNTAPFTEVLLVPLPLQIKELVGICKEYVIALRCELKRKELREDDMARAAELAAYFTHCNLQVRLGPQQTQDDAAHIQYLMQWQAARQPAAVHASR